MRTLRAGTKPKMYPWVGVWSCLYCRGIYELTEEDIALVSEYHDGYDGDWCNVLCPTCKTGRVMHPADRPQSMIDGAPIE